LGYYIIKRYSNLNGILFCVKHLSASNIHLNKWILNMLVMTLFSSSMVKKLSFEKKTRVANHNGNLRNISLRTDMSIIFKKQKLPRIWIILSCKSSRWIVLRMVSILFYLLVRCAIQFWFPDYGWVLFEYSSLDIGVSSLCIWVYS
jgi:hypothetical protein